MTLSELEALPTRQLLARLKRLQQCEETLALSDRGTVEQKAFHTIEFKDSREWIAAYDQSRTLLAQREHVPKGGELVSLRHERVLSASTSEHRSGKHKKR